MLCTISPYLYRAIFFEKKTHFMFGVIKILIKLSPKIEVSFQNWRID